MIRDSRFLKEIGWNLCLGVAQDIRDRGIGHKFSVQRKSENELSAHTNWTTN